MPNSLIKPSSLDVAPATPAIAVFSRFADAPAEDNGVRMGCNVLDTRVLNLCLSEVIGRFEDFTKSPLEGAAMFPWATRFVLGFPLPSWQRPLCWTDAQKVKFIESIWGGVDIGSYMVNGNYELVGKPGEKHYREFSEVLLDGQQRLSTIEDYLLNKFSVPDAEGNPMFWRDLPRVERRRFGSFHFARADIHTWAEAHLRLAYDLRAFGGTEHTEEQRATVALPEGRVVVEAPVLAGISGSQRAQL